MMLSFSRLCNSCANVRILEHPMATELSYCKFVIASFHFALESLQIVGPIFQKFTI